MRQVRKKIAVTCSIIRLPSIFVIVLYEHLRLTSSHLNSINKILCPLLLTWYKNQRRKIGRICCWKKRGMIKEET
jgi:hypothetical protein